MTVTNRFSYILAIIGIIASLEFMSQSNYLLFHSFVELFSVVIAVGIFVIAWETRRFAEDSGLLFLGIAYFFVAILDLLHMFSFKGMGIFPGATTNLPTQL